MQSAVKVAEQFSGKLSGPGQCSTEKLDPDVLLKLFSALDLALQLLSRRGQRGFHSTVKADVESTTGRDLSDYRLGCVLGLVGSNVIDFRWTKSGRDAKLELFQRDENGKECFPSIEAMEQRKNNFKIALARAEKENRLLRVVLPERQETTARVVSSSSIPALPPQELMRTALPCASGAAARRESLLERVRARERCAAERRLLDKKYNDLRCQLGVCDDAETVYKLLQSLFARGEGKSSGASEEEILNALCSVSFGMQCVKTLERPAAQAALNLLIEKSSQWFSVQVGVHNPKARYIRRLPQGHGANALAGIQAERLSLEKHIRELCESLQDSVFANCVSQASSSSKIVKGTGTTSEVPSVSQASDSSGQLDLPSQAAKKQNKRQHETAGRQVQGRKSAKKPRSNTQK